MNTVSNTAALTIFCGKGGVGKTSMSLAFALRHASEGRPVLVVTSHPLRELAVSVSLAGLKEMSSQAASNLFIVHIDPFEILGHKVRDVVPSELLVKRVLASPIYKNLVEVAPGLKEIAFLGRLHELVEHRSQKEVPGRYSLLVWDAPATGHFLQTLRVSRSFQTYLSGPFALLGEEVAEFFADTSNLEIIPVTTLEEMAVDETIEICEKLQGEMDVRPAAVIGNMASPLLALPEPEFETVRRWVAEQSGNAASLEFMIGRHLIERSLFDKLRSAIHAPFHVVQRASSWKSDLDLLMNLSRQLGGISRV